MCVCVVSPALGALDPDSGGPGWPGSGPCGSEQWYVPPGACAVPLSGLVLVGAACGTRNNSVPLSGVRGGPAPTPSPEGSDGMCGLYSEWTLDF